MNKIFDKIRGLPLMILVVAHLIGLLAVTANATSFTDYAENNFVDHQFRGTTYSATAPANYFVSLHTVACGDATAGTEVSTLGTAYARVSIARSQVAWKSTQGTAGVASTGTGGTISNAASIDFNAPTADWTPTTQIVSFAINDAATAGNMIVCEALTTPKSVNNGDAAPSFAIDALTIQIDN